MNLKAINLSLAMVTGFAIAAAKQSTELAIKAKDNSYVKLNKDLISSLR